MAARVCQFRVNRIFALPAVLRKPAYGALMLVCAAGLWGCRRTQGGVEPVIEFTHVPEAEVGSPEQLAPIAGRVTGAAPADRLVLYALSGVWWIQPVTERPFTMIQKDSSWINQTHPGSVYAALLVDWRYRPVLKMVALPRKGGLIRSVATVKGTAPQVPLHMLQLSGYQWAVRESAADGASGNFYDPENAWTDNRGFLHMRIARKGERWAEAGVRLSRSLGYGSYRFVVEDVSHLEPAGVFTIFSWDDQASKEMDFQVSRWGQPDDKNAQFLVQPWDVPANTVRFDAPPGVLNYVFRWAPGLVEFQAMRGSSSKSGMPAMADHTFTSGVPPAGAERLGFGLYVYDHSPRPMQHETEVVIESFEFLP